MRSLSFAIIAAGPRPAKVSVSIPSARLAHTENPSSVSGASTCEARYQSQAAIPLVSPARAVSKLTASWITLHPPGLQLHRLHTTVLCSASRGASGARQLPGRSVWHCRARGPSRGVAASRSEGTTKLVQVGSSRVLRRSTLHLRGGSGAQQLPEGSWP
jgi:hypothetical protein